MAWVAGVGRTSSPRGARRAGAAGAASTRTGRPPRAGSCCRPLTGGFRPGCKRGPALQPAVLRRLGSRSVPRLPGGAVLPSPATHAILTVLMAGETVYLLHKVYKTLLDTL